MCISTLLYHNYFVTIKLSSLHVTETTLHLQYSCNITTIFLSSLQAERKLEATQETIIDQQQTIEKFRELVRHLQDDITELRQKGEKSSGSGGEGGADSMAQSQTMMNLNVQLKSTMKAHARVSESRFLAPNYTFNPLKRENLPIKDKMNYM